MASSLCKRGAQAWHQHKRVVLQIQVPIIRHGAAIWSFGRSCITRTDSLVGLADMCSELPPSANGSHTRGRSRRRLKLQVIPCLISQASPAQNVGMETAQSPTDAGPSGFPQSPSEFDADPRIAFSKVDEKFLLETEEGAEFEWDNALRRWIPVVGIVPLSHHHHHEEAVPPLRTRS